MANKSYTEFKKLLELDGYCFSTSIVNFSRNKHNNHVSDYLDFDMFNNLNDGINTIKSDTINSNILINKRSFFSLKLPRINVKYLYSEDEMVEFYTVGPYIILINTLKNNTNSDKIELVKNYSVGSKGIFKLFNSIIKNSLVKNNNKFMKDLKFRFLK